MEPRLQRETVTLGAYRMLAFRASRNLSPGYNISATTQNYADVLSAATNLPPRLAYLIRCLYGYEVIWQFRIVNDEIYLWLPQTHKAAGDAVSQTAMVDLLCQVVNEACGSMIVAPTDWAVENHRVLFEHHGAGSNLGDVGKSLAQILDWTCE